MIDPTLSSSPPAPTVLGSSRVSDDRAGSLPETSDEADEADEQYLMHRILIASPWERYQLDRDLATPDLRDDET